MRPARTEERSETMLLAEILREGERVLDHQARALNELDDKAEQMIRLGVLALGGGVALLALIRSWTGLEGWGPYVPIPITGGVLNVVALTFFAGAYLGYVRPSEVHVGPRTDWLAQKAVDSDWRAADHFVSLLQDLPRYAAWNRRTLRRAASRLHQGFYCLLVAVVLYACGLVLILARPMGG